MADTEVKKKKNKKKKKSQTDVNANPVSQGDAHSQNDAQKDTLKCNVSNQSKLSQNGEQKEALNITDILPKKVGMTAIFNEVEVTMTHGGESVPDTSSKKKKKKKKSKDESSSAQKTNSNSTEQNLLNFEKDHIELVNHPEISVTSIQNAQKISSQKVDKSVNNNNNSSKSKSNKNKQDKQITNNNNPGKAKTSNNSSDKTKSDNPKAQNSNNSGNPKAPNSNNSDNPKAPNSNNSKSKTNSNSAKVNASAEDKAKTNNNQGKTKSKNVGSSNSNNPTKTNITENSGKASAEKAESSESTKKKKKKKKKKSSAELPTPNPNEANDDSAPTYVKLPAAGDNCVLLVSHENFSSVPDNSNPAPNGSNNTVLIKSNERPMIPEAMRNFQPIVETTSANLFPASIGKTSEKDEFNAESSFKQKVTELMKNENNDAQGNGAETKTKAQLKAERRALQEAQRMAKLAKNSEKDTAKVLDQTTASVKSVPPKPKETTKTTTKSSTGDKDTIRKIQIFTHLSNSIDFPKVTSDLVVHPSILELGSHYRKGTLCGSNARCVGFLSAFRDVLRDYRTPEGKDLSRDLEAKLQMYLSFLGSCRPLSVSITNVVMLLKHQINHTPKDMDEKEAKARLSDWINDFVQEDILLAKKAISNFITAKIVDDDNILVFAYSSLVKDVLCEAHAQGKNFNVIVVDSRPRLEGREMLYRLVKQGVRCSYVMINAASYVMKNVSKVIIGAHALLANGCVMSRLGSKQLSLVASAHGVPVLVLCETYKFCDRVLTDSFVHNELADPDELIDTNITRNAASINKSDCLKDHKNLNTLQVYNVMYDVTPSDLISVVITEKGLLPCTSVPVVLRVKHAGLQEP